MKIILGIGNPGANYDGTRHNVGFAAIDALARQGGADFREKAKFSALVAETTISGEKCLLVKPQTFYNDSGIAARALLDFYKLTIDDLLVVHDDVVLDFGKVRIRHGGLYARGPRHARALQAISRAHPLEPAGATPEPPREDVPEPTTPAPAAPASARPPLRCRHCGAPLSLVAVLPRRRGPP